MRPRCSVHLPFVVILVALLLGACEQDPAGPTASPRPQLLTVSSPGSYDALSVGALSQLRSG
jgi:hypothetical protein